MTRGDWAWLTFGAAGACMGAVMVLGTLIGWWQL